MAIKVRPKGLGSLYGKLGILAGKSAAARKEEDRLQQMEMQLQRQEHIREMATFNAQLRLQTEQRARMWELEKMDMRSRIDFEREERNRQRKLDERQAQTDALDRALRDGVIDEEDYNLAYLQITSGIPVYSQAQIAQRQVYTQEQIAKRAGVKPEFGRTDVVAAMKGLQEIGEKREKGKYIWNILAPDITEEDIKAEEYYKSIIESVTPEADIAKTYSIGDTIERGGKRYKVVGYDTDGTPLVELI